MTRDPLYDLADPGLRALFQHLTSDPTPDELSGERAALAMFRSANSVQVTLRSRSSLRSRHSRWRSRAGGRFVAACTALTVFGGFAAAAYADVLPAALQRIANDLIDAPDRPPVRPHVSPTGPAGSASRSSHSHSPSAPSRSGSSPSPHPTSQSPSAPPGSARLTITAAQRQITAGDSVRITASLTYSRRPAKDVQLSLTELPAGRRSAWLTVSQAATGAQGSAVFTVASLTTNALFRVIGPYQIASAELSIVVIPTVSLTPASGHPKHSDLLMVGAPLAQRGDAVELEVSAAAGQWQVVRTHRLGETGQVEFSVVARKISVTYRVVLLATAKHGQSVSNAVTVPARGQGRGTG